MFLNVLIISNRCKNGSKMVQFGSLIKRLFLLSKMDFYFAQECILPARAFAI